MTSAGRVAAFCLVMGLLPGCGLLQGPEEAVGDPAGSPAEPAHSVFSVPRVSAERRAAIEDHMLAHLLGAAPLSARDGVRSYVNLVGHWLLQQDRDPDYAWRFVVLDDPAFFVTGLPQGTVVVSSGLLADLSSEAELAAVLAIGIGQVQTGAYLSRSDADALNTQEPAMLARRLLGLGPAADALLLADFEALYRVVHAGYDPWALAALMQRWIALPESSFSDAVFSAPDLETRFERLRWPLHDEFLHAGGAEIAARYQGRVR